MSETHWTMIDVAPKQAQADCHLIEFPNGQKVLIDIADAVDAGGTALAYFRSHHIAKIDLVVISHFHKDHYGRLRDLIESGIEVDRVAGNMPAPNNAMAAAELPWGFDRNDAESLVEFLHEKNIPYFTPTIGQRLIEVPLREGGVAALDVVCLYDGVHTPIGYTSVNDTSMIVRLSHGPTRVLFTGDLTGRMGQWLAGSKFDFSADILKVPHHGADWNNSYAFFERVHPKVALAPSPRALWFSLRCKMVRTYLTENHIPTYVSGINGDVTVILTTHGYTIRTQYPSIPNQ